VSEPGLARERTALAWGRTSLGAAAFGLAVVRLAMAHRSVPELIAGVIALITSVVLALAARSAHRENLDQRRYLPLRILTIATMTIGVLIVVSALTSMH
jgi:uncharacterized membrane protein YidH (DUF202 family)